MSVAEGYDPSRLAIHGKRCPVPTVDSGKARAGSILAEAERIVNGDRDTDYGDSNENLSRIASLATEMGQPITGRGVCIVMLAVKLARESHKHKRDNLVDLCGYAELLNRWESSAEMDDRNKEQPIG